VDSILLVPGGSFPGEFSWIDEPIVLTRMGTKRQEPGAEIVITKAIATTGYPERAWNPEHIAADVCYASVKEGDKLTPGLVLKFMDKGTRLGSDFFVEEFVLEAEYHSMAKDVQGYALPHFAGLFRSGSLYCLVFEDAGRDLTEEEYRSKDVKCVARSESSCSSTPGADRCRTEAVDALASLKAAGVSPYVTDRSIRRGHDGRIKISTLWHSTTREQMDEWVREPRLAHWTPDALWENECQGTIGLLDGIFRVGKEKVSMESSTPEARREKEQATLARLARIFNVGEDA